MTNNQTTDRYSQRRKELLESLLKRHKTIWHYGSSISSEGALKLLNESYGLDLKVDGLEKFGSVEFFYSLNHNGSYGYLNKSGGYEGYNPAILLANLIRGREMSVQDDRQFNLPDAVKVACENLVYGTWYGGSHFAMDYYAIDPFSDKVRTRSLTREEFEKQITAQITGADNEEQRKLLELYFEFKRNGQTFNGHYPEHFPKASWEKKPNRELSERQWEEYKRKHLNPNQQKSGLFKRIFSYFSS